MENEVIVKYVNESDIRFIVTKEKKVYTLKFLKEQADSWVAMVGNIKSDDTEELISSLLEKIFQDQQTNSILNKLQIPKDLPIVG
ncbi:hypothetical protein [Bacillus sp. B15-48]|uniref:hypothetical protein n=1 Tax=Bacillus sp. B15-48 TaxID=1548601 RepID=UPI00193FDC62|nr:hypothetical protein [Bacillus sp. B15-48]MBM4762993.1 hypothetical protein [Bacillus sp. B15-48]